MKGILLDLDHTLYDYEPCHKAGMSKVYAWMQETFSVGHESAEVAFTTARKHVNKSLAETASSHNRILYFQRMLETLNLPALEFSLEAYNKYWDTFLDTIRLDDGVEDTLMLFRKRSLKICLVTDLTAHIQHRKILKLHLHKYIDFMVTSEESGREKPDASMFTQALQKLHLKEDEVCMIGDNFEKDIQGATSLGIKSFWLNREPKHVTLPTGAEEINEFRALLMHPDFNF